MIVGRAHAAATARRLSAWIAASVIAGATIALASALLAGGLRLSGMRLTHRLEAITADVRNAADSQIGWAGIAFAAGVALGWSMALAWLGDRLRRRSLLLVDERGPDMSFRHAVEYVRDRVGGERAGHRGAATLIVEAARNGTLSLWQKGPSNLVRRVSRRQIVRASSQLAALAERMDAGQTMIAAADMRLLRIEVERLWPIVTIIKQDAR